MVRRKVQAINMFFFLYDFILSLFLEAEVEVALLRRVEELQEFTL